MIARLIAHWKKIIIAVVTAIVAVWENLCPGCEPLKALVMRSALILVSYLMAAAEIVAIVMIVVMVVLRLLHAADIFRHRP